MVVLRLVPTQGPPIPLEISKDRAVVGREPTCDVVVSDGSVSRKHAQLEQRPNGWFVVDQGSANGTFVNSQRVTETQLHNGQELRFGGIGFRIELEGADEAATILTSAPEVTVMQEAVKRPAPPAGPPAPPPPPAVKPAAPPWSTTPKPPVPPAPPAAPEPPPLPPRPAAGPPPVPPRATAPPSRGSAPPPPPPPSAGGPPPLPPRASRPVVTPLPPGAPPPGTKGRGPLFWVGGGCCGCLALVLILAGVIGGGVWFMTGAVVEAVRAQIADIKRGDIDAAYARMSEDYRSRVARDEFAALVARPSLMQNTDSTFTNRNVQNDTGTVAGTLSGGGVTEAVTYSLIKEGGEWKISGIDFEGGASPAGGGTTSSGGGGGSGTLRLETVAVDKTEDPPGHVVAIKVRAIGFGTQGSGDSLRTDLVLDLETRGPDGQRIPALSRMELQSRDRPDGTDPEPFVDFDVTLTVRDYTPGDYVARLTVRDQFGRDIRSQDVPFSLP